MKLKSYVVGTQALLMNTHNRCIYEEIEKIILEVSSILLLNNPSWLYT